MNKKEAAKIILKELEKISLFTGKYDAVNGNESYMHGISAVMECIAGFVSAETEDVFHDKFVSNMIESEEKRED